MRFNTQELSVLALLAQCKGDVDINLDDLHIGEEAKEIAIILLNKTPSNDVDVVRLRKWVKGLRENRRT